MSLYLLIPPVIGAPCNTTSNEPIVGSAVQVTHATINVGYIYDQIITSSAIYLSIFSGEKVKVFWNSSLAWAVDYGDYGHTLVISPDETFLIAGSSFGSLTYLGKLNSSDGAQLASYNMVGHSNVYS